MCNFPSNNYLMMREKGGERMRDEEERVRDEEEGVRDHGEVQVLFIIQE